MMNTYGRTGDQSVTTGETGRPVDGIGPPGRRLLRPPPDGAGPVDPGHHRHHGPRPDGGHPLREQVHGGQHPVAAGHEHSAGAFPSKSGDTADVVFHTTSPITTAANQAAIDQVVASVEPLPYVQSVTSPFSAAGAHQIAQPSKGNIAFAVVQFTTDTADIPVPAVKKVITTAQAAAHEGFQVELGGSPDQRRRHRRARAERGHRHHRRHPHHAARLRIRGRHGPAGHHRAGGARHRRRAAGAPHARPRPCRTSRPRWPP